MSRPDKQQQRVRVGLTGLACVFLLVMLAAVFLRAAGADGSAAQNSAAPPPANAAEAPNEPLATLGVAPGTPVPAPATSVAPGQHAKPTPTP